MALPDLRGNLDYLCGLLSLPQEYRGSSTAPGARSRLFKHSTGPRHFRVQLLLYAGPVVLWCFIRPFRSPAHCRHRAFPGSYFESGDRFRHVIDDARSAGLSQWTGPIRGMAGSCQEHVLLVRSARTRRGDGMVGNQLCHGRFSRNHIRNFCRHKFKVLSFMGMATWVLGTRRPSLVHRARLCFFGQESAIGCQPPRHR